MVQTKKEVNKSPVVKGIEWLAARFQNTAEKLERAQVKKQEEARRRTIQTTGLPRDARLPVKYDKQDAYLKLVAISLIPSLTFGGVTFLIGRNQGTKIGAHAERQKVKAERESSPQLRVNGNRLIAGQDDRFELLLGAHLGGIFLAEFQPKAEGTFVTTFRSKEGKVLRSFTYKVFSAETDAAVFSAAELAARDTKVDVMRVNDRRVLELILTVNGRKILPEIATVNFEFKQEDKQTKVKQRHAEEHNILELYAEADSSPPSTSARRGEPTP